MTEDGRKPFPSIPKRRSDTTEDIIDIEEIPVVRIRDRPPIDTLQEMMQGRPYVAQLVQMQLLYDMASILEDSLGEIGQLRKRMDEMVPEGKLYPREYNITSSKSLEIDKKLETTLPWRSFELTNYGPNKLFVMINDQRLVEEGALTMGELMNVDLKSPKITKITLLSEGTSSVRIYGQK